jgi:hypothetical protein
MPEYLEPNVNIFTDPGMNDLTEYPSNDGQQCAASESQPVHCPCMVPGCTGIQHFQSYSGLNGALTTDVQAHPSPLVTGSSAPACNVTFRPFDANPYSDPPQPYDVNSFLRSIAVETQSSSLSGAFTCICHYYISILGSYPSHFINAYGTNPTTQKNRVLPWCRGWLGLVIGSFM